MFFGNNLPIRAMNAHNRHLLRATLVSSALLPVASALMPSTPAVAADLPLPPPQLSAWTWTGFYLGGSAGATAGTATFSDPNGPSVFGDKVKTSGFLAGLQLGSNWEMGSRWLVGLQADASYLDSHGTYTCMKASGEIVGSDCQVSPRVLASLTGRGGFLVDPEGRTLLYSVGLDGRRRHRARTDTGLVDRPGIRLLSLRYHARFDSADDHLYRGHVPDIRHGRSNTSGVTPDMQVVKLALNYHWDRDPRAAWADAPVFGVAAMPVKARPALIADGWEVDAGTRYWYSSGTEKNTSGSGSLTSQLTYSNLTGHAGELFARVDSPWHVFVKGYVGAGALPAEKTPTRTGARPPTTRWGSW
jgi:hypothetical protein